MLEHAIGRASAQSTRWGTLAALCVATLAAHALGTGDAAPPHPAALLTGCTTHYPLSYPAPPQVSHDLRLTRGQEDVATYMRGQLVSVDGGAWAKLVGVDVESRELVLEDFDGAVHGVAVESIRELRVKTRSTGARIGTTVAVGVALGAAGAAGGLAIGARSGEIGPTCLGMLGGAVVGGGVGAGVTVYAMGPRAHELGHPQWDIALPAAPTRESDVPAVAPPPAPPAPPVQGGPAYDAVPAPPAPPAEAPAESSGGEAAPEAPDAPSPSDSVDLRVEAEAP